MYLLYILDTVRGYVSKSRFEESHKKQTKPATLFDVDIWMDPATTLRAVCFCKDFFKLGFSPCKAEQPLRGRSYKKKKHKKRL